MHLAHIHISSAQGTQRALKLNLFAKFHECRKGTAPTHIHLYYFDKHSVYI